jgi:hypothetical protein
MRRSYVVPMRWMVIYEYEDQERRIVLIVKSYKTTTRAICRDFIM